MSDVDFYEAMIDKIQTCRTFVTHTRFGFEKIYQFFQMIEDFEFEEENVPRKKVFN